MGGAMMDRRIMGRGREYGIGNQGQKGMETEILKEMQGKIDKLMEWTRKNQH